MYEENSMPIGDKECLVVKIYFDDKTPLVDDNDTREESRYHTTLKGRELRHNRYSQLSQHSVIRGKLSPFIYRARETIFSFLETFGLTVSKKPLNSFEKGTTQSPRVSPKPWRKLQQSLVSSLAPDKPCPTKHLGKVGLLEVNNNTVGIEEVEQNAPLVRNGGWWKPPCKPRAKVAIVVPFRDRESHLNIFLRHMHQFLQWQLLEYRIFITQQTDRKPFNRGMLMNVGFQQALKRDNFTCVIFHDVDLLPEDARNDYSCPSSPRHMSVAVDKLNYKLRYKELFGGVEGFWSWHFIQINGFPNRFWGWGGEDDDLYNRITEKGLNLTRPEHMIGRYTMLGHTHNENDVNPSRFDELRRSKMCINTDGLNSLTYQLLDYQELPLYTFISVNLGNYSFETGCGRITKTLDQPFLSWFGIYDE